MSILNDVLLWSEKDLSLWLRDAARRLLFNDQLTAQDHKELYLLLKAGKGITIEGDLKAIPLSADHIPVEGVLQLHVALKTLGNFQHINKIMSGQTLTFSEKGMTVIYGGNGAGKSGYARVLKHACRARDRGGEILGDVTQGHQAKAIPQATFSVSAGGKDQTIQWSSGTVPPKILSGIGVFDTSCANSYLVEGEAAYLPRGLDIVEGLANKVVPEVSALLTSEIAQINVSKDFIVGFDQATTVGKTLLKIGTKPFKDEISKLGVLSDEEVRIMGDLEQAIAEPDPILKFQSIKTSATHVKNLATRVKEKERYASQKVLDQLITLALEAFEAKRGVGIAAEELRAGDNLLPGTGEAIWKQLFIAARRYSTEVAYVGSDFPSETPDASCVLCQQPVAEANKRLHRFDNYINENASKLATEKQEALDNAIDTIDRSSVDYGFDDALTTELEDAPVDLRRRIRTYQDQLENYKIWLVSSASKNIWKNRPELIDSPVSELRSIAAKKLWSARIYKKASDPKKIQSLTIELKALTSRSALSAVLEAVISLHDRIIYRGVLDSCKAELNPRILSAKSKDIAGRLITKTLRDSLEDEFRKLGVSHIKTKLKERVDRGTVKFTLLLDLPAAKKIDLILSEGEQRAIALGSFLAELKLSNHGGGIIFDDPVSSLDHIRRRRFATRLVDESSIRQVIVLTHDIAFLSELIDSLAESAEIPHRIHHLEWVGEEAGVIKQGLPWDKTGYKERVAVLQARAKSMAPWPTYPNDELIGEVRLIYSDIRATVERVVEDVVLNGIVTRFSDMVGVGNLHKITGLRKEDVDQIVSLWKKCHRITGAHHQAPSKEIPVEGLEEIIIDIDSILTMAKNVVSYRAKPDGA